MTISIDYTRQTWVYKIEPARFEPDSYGQALLLDQATVTVFDGGEPDVSVKGKIATKAGKLHARASGTYTGYGQVSDDLRAAVLDHWQEHDAPKPVQAWCVECGNLNDDNPGQPLCRTCSDWLVTDESNDSAGDDTTTVG